MLYHSHLQTASKLISGYRHAEPLHHYLKAFFRENKKYGSRDRKLVSSLCYNYFRLGAGFKSYDLEFKILLGFFLSQQSSTPFLKNVQPGWDIHIAETISGKLAISGVDEPLEIFKFKEELSPDVDGDAFEDSFMIQPKLFIRIRPGYYKRVIDKLHSSKIPFEKISGDCIAFANATKIEHVLDVGKEVIIQDRNSQQTGAIIKSYINEDTTTKQIWDCCAGSGGKSLMLNDLLQNVSLTVTDKRTSIINNLYARFKKAGIKDYAAFVADLDAVNEAELSSLLNNQSFDIVLADVPCTGSGTWARTPEGLRFFKKSEILRYVNIQRSIIEKSIHFLKRDAFFVYITCSVFKKENEDQVEFIQERGLKLVHSKLLAGYHEQADTLFMAIFKN